MKLTVTYLKTFGKKKIELVKLNLHVTHSTRFAIEKGLRGQQCNGKTRLEKTKNEKKKTKTKN